MRKTTIFFLFICHYTFAQNLLLNSGFEDSLDNWSTRVANSDYTATFTVTTAETYNGSKSLFVDVTKVKADYWAFRYHNIRIAQSGFSCADGDVLLLRFWAKCLNNVELHPMIQAGVARNTTEQSDFWALEDYDMSNFWVTNQWAQYEMKLVITKNTGSDIKLILRFGGMTGNYYVDDIELIKSGSIISDNNWLQQAQNRIDTLRKGNLQLTILDKDGEPMANTQISVELLRHNFQWGTAVQSVTPTTFNNATYQWERTEILTIFNTIVNENDFKWPQVEPTRNTVNYNNVNLYIDWKDSNNLQFRGHCLYWTKEMYMPSWWPALNNTDKISSLKTRCQRDVSYFKGRVKEYDVVNEPVHFPYVEDQIGDSIYTQTFNWVHNADTQAVLYVNDWWNIDKWDSWRLRRWVEKRQSEGAVIHGIGLQSHWDNERVDWREVKYKSDYLAETGLKLKITEFDMDYIRIGMTRVQQATDYGIIMRLAFSHPAYDGFLIWGLKDGWRDDAGIYNDDNTPRPSRDTMYKLIKQIWTTNLSGQTNALGGYAFNGYYGNYKVTVTYENQQKIQYVNFSADNKIKSVQTEHDFVSSVSNAAPLAFNIKTWPNPASNFLFVKVEDETNKKIHVRLYSVGGMPVYDYVHRTNEEFTVNLRGLSSGDYLLSVEKDQILKFSKIMVR